ncbi:SCO2583 family membrane protein [Streptomyces sp. O3]
MTGPGDPPEGTPEGVPGGGEEEYRSTVFDESFVRAARLQEFSARERLTEHAPAVRRLAGRSGRTVGGLLRVQFLILAVLVAAAFAAAFFMGLRQSEPRAVARPVGPLRMTVVPLVPTGQVPGAARADVLFARSPAAEFKAGAAGIGLPAARRTEHFSEGQVMTALTTAKDYLVQSSLDPAVLTGGAVRPVRILLDADQFDQFDRSVRHPAADGLHAATGWLVRFDPERTALADARVRVRGRMRIAESGPDALEVTSAHTFVYALKPVGAAGAAGAVGAAGGDARVSLFTVRRELRFRFDQDDLRLRRAELLASDLQAGPMACPEDPADAAERLRPLLAGQRAETGGPAGVDPYATGGTPVLCGVLAASAQPSSSA